MKASHETTSGNGALKYSTSGNDFVDDFASIAKYKEPRSYEEVAKTMQLLYSIDKVKAVKMAIFIRLITRKSQVMKDKGVETLEEVQRGQGLKNEGIMRMLWFGSQPFKRIQGKPSSVHRSRFLERRHHYDEP